MSVPVLETLDPRALGITAVLCDLWGVVHDGVRAFPETVTALCALRARGVPVGLLSNVPRRVDTVIALLDRVGVPRDAYDFVLSSGEAVHRALRDRTDPAFAALGPRCYELDEDTLVDHGTGSLLTGLTHVTRVAHVTEADFILNVDLPPRPGHALADYDSLIAAGLARDLPMVCANPDLNVVQDGKTVICGGALALAYEQRGGRVLRRGKPDPAIYHQARALLPGAPAAESVLMIGDSLTTDIPGAVAAGMPSLLLATGLLETRLAAGDGLDGAALAQVVAEAGTAPTWAMRHLKVAAA